jgi:predicted GH43/DUF377 family glycosyl hydrolase
MKWKKLGRIFCPTGEKEWMLSHAANPVADYVGGDIFRIYFSTRNAKNQSSIGWIEIDLRIPKKIIRVAEDPALTPGKIGCFDDSGCSIGSIVRQGERRLMYYMGWNLGVTVPWRNSIGLAISNDSGEHFERVSIAPLVDRSDVDPFTLSYPWVLQDKESWQMWYGSNLHWGYTQADMFHIIKCATSTDGYVWQRNKETIIVPNNNTEFAFARPCVIKENGKYQMWYAYRGDAYQIGYAESTDGISWVRRDHEVGIASSTGEWDGESIEYPCVFSHAEQKYLLYCGDGYGRTGFGLAILECE